MTESEPMTLASASISGFTKFPELPTELRLKIWSYAATAQRLLELQYCIVDRKFFSFQKLPAILHTSQESRAVGLCYYHLSFGTDKHPPDTYFNAVNDILFFGSEQYDDEIEYMVRYFDKQRDLLEPRDQIQNIALAEYLWRRDLAYSPFATRRGHRSIQKFARTFPQLKQLFCVKGRNIPFNGEEADGELLLGSGNYARPSLVESGSGCELLRNPSLALEAVISTFRVGQLEAPERRYPEVTVMELRRS
jgi:2EXR family